ncbi:emopamil-binding family protein [Phanerochaete sordida]|uniref:Emopamil-binding family protein n=1 Tax=Phanerochaete sordida TaxID=48140 RepID=A0A9P3GPF8_9APHY|nr:emopamil-binding family protein [Phanerochaete sordida]
MSTATGGVEWFTTSSAYSLAFIGAIGVVAYLSANAFLPRKATSMDRFTWIWLTFDALIHFSFEAIFLYYSVFGRQVATSEGVLPEMVKEYALADLRWAVADPTVVSLEILTVLGAGPMACYILKQLAADDPARHYWIVVLCTAELYGGWMTFCPEWLTGSPNLVISNPLYLWVYLTLMNGMQVWVVVPLGLMVDSYKHIASSLRSAQAVQRSVKTE